MIGYPQSTTNFYNPRSRLGTRVNTGGNGMQPDGFDQVESFMAECRSIVSEVHAAILADTPTDIAINSRPDCVFIKATDGTILDCNDSYRKLFSHHVSPTGRLGSAYLDESLIAASQLSDQLIISGADDVVFTHPCRDSHGRSITLRTYKSSLLGLGHPRYAILGICRLMRVSISDRHVRLLPLHASWNQFAKLKPRDQQIAAALARGEKLKTIASELSVSDKTVENARSQIFRHMNLDQAADLIKLLVRLQDNGFADFGL
ncbi:LuxR C-terminal-related transcriptional regulator [Rubripirellula reticaptiva]|uniref:Response regulator n=1 Tax=Rubripirellula reticaptiva TaxID=2528013 RepID=A0A5C6EIF6_9BACT|nr:LuxR C-terminal-related transcriptional regulator [Rubripirellula reticaptiva]TWU47867.1 response regulator [Rubripirellula reticaptiva]